MDRLILRTLTYIQEGTGNGKTEKKFLSDEISASAYTSLLTSMLMNYRIKAYNYLAINFLSTYHSCINITASFVILKHQIFLASECTAQLKQYVLCYFWPSVSDKRFLEASTAVAMAIYWWWKGPRWHEDGRGLSSRGKYNGSETDITIKVMWPPGVSETERYDCYDW